LELYLPEGRVGAALARAARATKAIKSLSMFEWQGIKAQNWRSIESSYVWL
jgi:hypothetical protein